MRSRISTERRQLNGGMRHYDTSSFKDMITVQYQDSGFSEEDADLQVTTCLMKTPSGSIYIQPTDQNLKSLTLDSRLEPHYSQPGYSTTCKDTSSSERSTSQLKPKAGGGGGGLVGSSSLAKSTSCSWRALAIFFIVLTIAMAATLAFVIASSLVSPGETEAAKACAVVDTLPDSPAEVNNRPRTKSPQDSRESFPSEVSVARSVGPPELSIARSVPPDGSSFQQVQFQEKVATSIPPFGYLNLQFFHKESSYLTFDLWMPRGASFGLYARRNALPTHTHYTLMHVLTGYKKDRTTRSTSMVQRVEHLYLEEGHWFLSIYNDDGDSQAVELTISTSAQLTGKLSPLLSPPLHS
jgi:hypothetical protein